MSDRSDFYSQSDPESMREIRPYDAFETNHLAPNKERFSFVEFLLGPKAKQPEITDIEKEIPLAVENTLSAKDQEAARQLAKEQEQIQQTELALLEAEQLREQAQIAMSNAQKQAEIIIEQATHKKEEFEAQAYQDGFSQGESAGKKLTEQKVESVMRSLNKIVQSADESRKQLMDNSQRELVRLAYLMASQIIHREIKLSQSVVLDIVRAAMEKIQRSEKLTLYISPKDFRFIEGHIEQFKEMLDEDSNMGIEIDEQIKSGGCRLVGDTGEVDATVESMLDNLCKQIWEDS